MKALEILGILYEEDDTSGMSVNEIFRKTGSKDKPIVIKSIKYLEKSRLVETKETHYKQKTPKILTRLGQEFAGYIDSVNQYNNSYQKLKEAIKNNYDMWRDTNEKARRNMLRTKGWSDKNITNYDEDLKTVHQVRIVISPDNIIDVVVSKYISLLSEIYHTKNKNTVLILNRILTDLLSKQFALIVEDLDDNRKSKSILELKNYRGDDLTFHDALWNKLNVLDIALEGYASLENTFIYKQIKDALLSILRISKPRKGYIDDVVTGDLETIKDIYYKEEESFYQKQ